MAPLVAFHCSGVGGNEGGSRMVEKSQVWNPDAPCISMYGIRTIMYHLNWVEWFGQMLGFIFQHIYLTKPSFF